MVQLRDQIVLLRFRFEHRGLKCECRDSKSFSGVDGPSAVRGGLSADRRSDDSWVCDGLWNRWLREGEGAPRKSWRTFMGMGCNVPFDAVIQLAKFDRCLLS